MYHTYVAYVLTENKNAVHIPMRRDFDTNILQTKYIFNMI